MICSTNHQHCVSVLYTMCRVLGYLLGKLINLNRLIKQFLSLFAFSSHKQKLSHRFTSITTDSENGMMSLMSVSRFDVDEYMMNVSFSIFLENKTMGKKE